MKFLRAIGEGRCRERRYADRIFIKTGPILQNAPYRSQILNFFASVGKGALTPLTKILRTPLVTVFWQVYHLGM